MAFCRCRVSELLVDQARERSQPGNEEIFATLHFDERRKIEQERLFGAGHHHLRTFAAGAVDRVLLAWIKSDELAALHPFFLDELELPFDIGLDEQIDQATIDTVILKRAVLEMRSVLDTAPEQPVPPHRCCAF